MATETQLKLIADIEAAVTAMTRDRKPEGVTITEIMEMTGRDIHNLRPMILRLSDLGELDLLKRLQLAFSRVGLKQAALEKELVRLEGRGESTEEQPVLKLEPKLPPVEKRPAQTNGTGSPVPDDIETVSTVLRILQPLPKTVQAKVLNSAAVFLGVGE